MLTPPAQLQPPPDQSVTPFSLSISYDVLLFTKPAQAVGSSLRVPSQKGPGWPARNVPPKRLTVSQFLPAKITLLTQLIMIRQPQGHISRVLSAAVFFASLLQTRNGRISTPRLHRQQVSEWDRTGQNWPGQGTASTQHTVI
ncbi:uncharacterized protein SPSK_05658 [Sporothrix schenckii 1099-18]|uniref:Uncharacterized protein n=1 Tax=Sporothrix schenckii 1099-18 TaxID=1397361 RepID=A0A0F2LSE3_SPOSC|nr:uncharacterized protein SPSK_05658 [Sporothrix schenckii 1099-18]KJR80428.1 hypothetical protein SPSK_05658 [Sporothrix schenckii 1099-18]